MSVSSPTLAELTTEVRAFVAERDWERFHSPRNLAMAVSVEAAELLEHFRFRSDEEMQLRLRDETRRAEIGHELADVLYFVLLMSANLGYDVSTILRQKLELSAHNYPVEQARGVNEKYTEL